MDRCREQRRLDAKCLEVLWTAVPLSPSAQSALLYFVGRRQKTTTSQTRETSVSREVVTGDLQGPIQESQPQLNFRSLVREYGVPRKGCFSSRADALPFCFCSLPLRKVAVTAVNCRCLQGVAVKVSEFRYGPTCGRGLRQGLNQQRRGVEAQGTGSNTGPKQARMGHPARGRAPGGRSTQRKFFFFFHLPPEVLALEFIAMQGSVFPLSRRR